MVDILNSQGINAAPIYRRNSGGIIDAIVASRVVAGNADFFSVAGLNLTLIADATDPFEYNIGGATYQLLANVVFAVTDDAHNFIWIDDTGALGRQATPPLYSFTAPGAPATGDHWYDLGKGQMKSWSGAAWVAVNRIFIGYVRADATVINAAYACEPTSLSPIRRFEVFGDGSDGFLDVNAGTTTIDTLKQYTAVVVRGAAGVINHTATTLLDTASIVLDLYSQGPIILIGTGGAAGIVLTGKGAPSGVPAVGAGGGGSGSTSGATGGGGGGGTSAGGKGGYAYPYQHLGAVMYGGDGGIAGGGAGGNGAVIFFPTSGIRHPISARWGLGTGGGAGGGSGVAVGGAGGAGGGSAMIAAPAFVIGVNNNLLAKGADGSVGPGDSRGGGGGGGGGIIMVYSRNYINSGTVSAAGGTGGGSGGASSGAGGNGFAGLIMNKKF